MSSTQFGPDQEKGPLRVFLSHASEDKPVIRELYDRLKSDGFAPWLDEKELLPGQDWRAEIPTAVRACDVVIICLSRISVTKEGYLQREIRDAIYTAEEKPEGTIFIIPVRIEPDVEVPKSLSRWQRADLFQSGGYEQIVRALKTREKSRAKVPIVQHPQAQLKPSDPARGVLISPPVWKTQKKKIGLILNEETPHIRDVASAFRAQIKSVAPRYIFIEEIGSANMHDDPANQKAFRKVLRDKPDIIVTVGTQVSVYAMKKHPKYPRFFVMISNPIESKLISKDEVQERGSNVAGFSNGIVNDLMVKDLAAYFPGKKFGFLYSAHQLQDLQMRDFLESQRTIDVVAIEVDVNSPRIDPRGCDLFFGWNMLNTNIDTFVRKNPNVPIIGPQYENISSDVVASYGADCKELGEQSATFLLENFFAKQSPLGSLPIKFPNLAKLQVNEARLQHFGLQLGNGCTSPEAR